MEQTSTAVFGRTADAKPSYVEELAELLRVLLVAGIPTGIVVAGFGSRVVMFILRLTSPDLVRGLESDDGFVIGQVTLGGTYNLLVIGAVTGFIGAAAYVVAAPWLLGPSWFRRLTVGLTAGVIVGSLLVHDEGIDFNVLEPTWLAVGLFVALPVVVGVVLTFAVDRAGRPDSWAARGNNRWVVPLVLVALVPLALVVIVPVSLVVAALLPLRRVALEATLRSNVASWAVRAGLLCFPLAGLVALSQDLADLY